jgi:SAM-dependent methyltransferase
MTRRPIGLAPDAPAEGSGQDAKKYSTRNPLVQHLIARWLQAVRLAVAQPHGIVVDVGVGEGIALERIVPAGSPVVGVEYRRDKLLLAAQHVEGLAGVVADAGMLPLRDSTADVTTCIEVLEHLVAPEPAVEELARITSRRCVVSVPWEPWFRLGNLGRGKNVTRIGNDIEHVQQFTPRRLERLLARYFDVVDVVRVFPWLVAIAHVSSDGGAPERSDARERRRAQHRPRQPARSTDGR